MAWRIKYRESALKEMKKLSRKDREDAHNYLKNRIACADHPKDFGKALLHDKSGLWRYRVGKIRLICQINESALKVLVVKVGQRNKVYQG